jgi:hypothetical protein
MTAPERTTAYTDTDNEKPSSWVATQLLNNLDLAALRGRT